MKRRELTIYIDAPQEEWDAFLAEIEKAEMQLAQLELEARHLSELAEPAEPMLPPWLQRVMEAID